MSFDFLAPHYRWMEWLLAGEKLQRARLKWIEQVRGCQNVLLVGEGPGRFLEECVRVLPRAQITCVDASGGMLEEARRRYESCPGEKPRVQFVQASLPGWKAAPGTFDLIVTNFFFDCFTQDQLRTIIPALSAAATRDASWLVTEFAEPARGWRRWRAQMILAAAYIFFRWTTRLSARRLPEYDELLRQSGFQLKRRADSEWGLLTSDLWRKS